LDDRVYECTGTSPEPGLVVLGNANICMSVFEDTGEPFACIKYVGETLLVFDKELAETCCIEKGDSIHQIYSKYIPLANTIIDITNDELPTTVNGMVNLSADACSAFYKLSCSFYGQNTQIPWVTFGITIDNCNYLITAPLSYTVVVQQSTNVTVRSFRFEFRDVNNTLYTYAISSDVRAPNVWGLSRES